MTASDRFTVGPPGDEGADYQATSMEWSAVEMEVGDPIWFRKRQGYGDSAHYTEWEQGTFKLSWFYDGIIADVIADVDGRRVGLLLDLGDQLSRTDPRLVPKWT